jgi:broad specificity phosphatase PhoE
MYRLLNKKRDSSGDRPTVLALLRHGKTLWNEAGRIQGRQDSPLSTTGRKQVHDWGKFLNMYRIDQIIASDLGRVRETVAILQHYCSNAPVEWNSDLREQSWGDWEGKTFSELKQEQPEELITQIGAGWDFRPPAGESRKEVLKRALLVINEALLHFPGKQLLIVCHEGIIKSLIYHLAGRAFLPEEKKLLQKRQLHLLVEMNNSIQLGPLNILPTAEKMGKQ